MFQRYRFLALLEADRDFVPGWGHQPEDWANLLSDPFIRQDHYNTTVNILATQIGDKKFDVVEKKYKNPAVDSYRGSIESENEMLLLKMLGYTHVLRVAKDVSVVIVGSIQSAYKHKSDALEAWQRLNAMYKVEDAFEVVELVE